jgi:hypothetical protein
VNMETSPRCLLRPVRPHRLVLVPHLCPFRCCANNFQHGRPPAYAIIMASFFKIQPNSLCFDSRANVDAQLFCRNTEPYSDCHRLVTWNVGVNINH